MHIFLVRLLVNVIFLIIPQPRFIGIKTRKSIMINRSCRQTFVLYIGEVRLIAPRLSNCQVGFFSRYDFAYCIELDPHFIPSPFGHFKEHQIHMTCLQFTISAPGCCFSKRKAVFSVQVTWRLETHLEFAPSSPGEACPLWGDPLFCYSMNTSKHLWRLQNVTRSGYSDWGIDLLVTPRDPSNDMTWFKTNV